MHRAMIFAFAFLLLIILFPRLAPLDRSWRLWKKSRKKPSQTEIEIGAISYLVGGLRAGNDLLESLQNISGVNSNIRQRLRQISSKYDHSPLTLFVQNAITDGGSCISGLQRLKQQIRRRDQMRKKTLAASAQARVQAYTLIFLPPVFLLAICLTNPELIPSVFTNFFSLFLLFASLILLLLCWLWIKKMLISANKMQNPSDQLCCEQLPPYIEMALGKINSGHDIKSTKDFLDQEICFDFNSKKLSFTNLLLLPECPPTFHAINGLFERSQKFGSPIRQELNEILEDLFFNYEITLETNIQKLPVKLLAPLFLCALPAILLQLSAILLPLIFNTFE